MGLVNILLVLMKGVTWWEIGTMRQSGKTHHGIRRWHISLL